MTSKSFKQTNTDQIFVHAFAYSCLLPADNPCRVVPWPAIYKAHFETGPAVKVDRNPAVQGSVLLLLLLMCSHPKWPREPMLLVRLYYGHSAPLVGAGSQRNSRERVAWPKYKVLHSIVRAVVLLLSTK